MLDEGFEDIYGLSTWKDVKDWIKEGLDEKALIDLAGIEEFDQILGTGQYGRAYKIKGKELVLKLTTDPTEMEYGKILEGKTDLKAFLKVYKSINVRGVGRQGDLIPAQLRIQEMCFKVDWKVDNEYILLRAIQLYLDQILQGYEEDTGRNDVDLIFVDYFINTIEQDRGYRNAAQLMRTNSDKNFMLKVLQFGKDLLEEVGMLEGSTNLHDIDLHDDNVMQDKDGNLKMIDF